MGAGGRDFHAFNTRFKNEADYEVVAFTATQIPGIDNKTFPASLSGRLYPKGIPILPEDQLLNLIRDESIDAVVFAYSDVSHEYVMHQASSVISAGADFWLFRPPCLSLTAKSFRCRKKEIQTLPKKLFQLV